MWSTTLVYARQQLPFFGISLVALVPHGTVAHLLPRPCRQCVRTWEEYTTAIRLPGAWGSPLELQVLTRIYPEVSFLILGPGMKPCTICAQYQSPPDEANRIDLWLEGGHYELLRATVPLWVWEMVWTFDTERNATRVADVGVITVPDTPPSCPAANHAAWERCACSAANARASF